MPLPPRLGERGSHTLQRAWLADQEPGERGCAREGRAEKQGRRLLLFSFPYALQMGVHTKMEPELDTRLSSAL